MDAPNRFARVLKAYIEQEGMDVRTLSAQSGVTDASIYNYLNGKQLPREPTCRKLARALGQDPDDFAGVLERAKGEEQNDGREGNAGDSGASAGSATRSEGGEDEGDGADDLPPWEREDGWGRCERKSRRGLGTDHVTIGSDGGVYLGADLMRAAGLGDVEQVSLWKRDGAGGIESDPVGDYALGGESGVKVSGTHFRDWTGDGSVKAPVIGYGDGWVAFERPEGSA